VTLPDATVVVVGYRALTFWFPLLIGMVAFRNLNKPGDINNVKIN
jgi:uncharacterized membrane protein YbhN (UPF0104 family)